MNSAFLLFFLFVLSNALPNIQLLNLLTAPSLPLLQPYFANDTSTFQALSQNATLKMNQQFLPLLQYILSDFNISQIILANISTIIPLKWTSSMTLADKLGFLNIFLNNSLSFFYHMMTDNFYLTTEKQCQNYLSAIIATNATNVVSNILSPLTGSYFWNKRCILSRQNSLLNIIDQSIVTLTLDQKLLLVPVIKRMNVVHSIIFGIN